MQVERLIKTAFVILLTFTPGINHAQASSDKTVKDMIVISPGLQGGYAINDGWFWGFQVTGTLWQGKGYQEKFRGLTIGRRWSKEQVITYFDVQRSFITTGYGAGLAHIKDRTGTGEGIIGLHVKTWLGYFALGTYDMIVLKDRKNLHNIGLMGVLPYPVSN